MVMVMVASMEQILMVMMVTSMEQVGAPLVSVGRKNAVTKQEYYWEQLHSMLHKRYPATLDYSKDFDLATPNLFERWVMGSSLAHADLFANAAAMRSFPVFNFKF